MSATVFFLMLTIAFSGMLETPLMMTGVTSTSSQTIGTCVQPSDQFLASPSSVQDADAPWP